MNVKPMPLDPPLIQANGLGLHFKTAHGNLDILKDIRFEIHAGQKTSIIGPSGSGKTSLLMLLAGLEKASKGEILIDGNQLTQMDEDDLARLRLTYMGIVFQNFHLIPTMTALENVKLPLELAPKKFPNPEADAMVALKRVGLSHRLDHMPAMLSGGEQQRVALARAFVANPKIILADEPTGNLDKQTGEEVIQYLFELCNLNQTALILITHDFQLASRCDKIFRMEDGVLSLG